MVHSCATSAWKPGMGLGSILRTSNFDLLSPNYRNVRNTENSLLIFPNSTALSFPPTDAECVVASLQYCPTG